MRIVYILSVYLRVNILYSVRKRKVLHKTNIKLLFLTELNENKKL